MGDQQPHSSPQASPRGSISISASQSDPHAELAQLKAQVQQMYAAMHQQFAQQAAQQPSAGAMSASVPFAARPPKIRPPSTYAGTSGFTVDDWIGEMQQQFAYYGTAFADERTCVKFAVANLAGPAMHWWEHVPDEQRPNNWSEFVTLLRARYRPVQAAMLARQRIGKLRMGPNHTVNAYTSMFQTTLTPIEDMGDADQVHHYVNGLQPHLAAKVWERHPKTLKDAIDFAVSAEAMGNFGRAAMPARPAYGHGGRTYGGHGNTSSASSSSVPMDINSVASFLQEETEQSPPPAIDAMAAVLAKMEAMQQTINSLQQSGDSQFRRHDGDRIAGLKPGDIAALRAAGKCFRCKKEGHMKNECPNRPKSSFQ